MRRLARAFTAIVLLAVPALAAAQAVGAGGHDHHATAQAEQQADHAGHSSLFTPRESSGTAWVPAATPMYGVETAAGTWSFMWHGNAFAQFLHESGARGGHQAGSINWVMGMARRRAGAGVVGFRGMFSLEPLTIRGCGYPDLLASGETCDGEPIHDRQHPHDLFMELAGEYARPVGRGAPVRRARRGTRARTAGLSTPLLGHGQPACAHLAPLARCDAHHLWRDHHRPVERALEGRGVGVQRPRAR